MFSRTDHSAKSDNSGQTDNERWNYCYGVMVSTNTKWFHDFCSSTFCSPSFLFVSEEDGSFSLASCFSLPDSAVVCSVDLLSDGLSVERGVKRYAMWVRRVSRTKRRYLVECTAESGEKLIGATTRKIESSPHEDVCKRNLKSALNFPSASSKSFPKDFRPFEKCHARLHSCPRD